MAIVGSRDLRSLKKIDWHKVAVLDAFLIQNAPRPRRRSALRLVSELLFSRFDIKTKQATEFLCFRSLNRSDYKELFELVIDTITAPKVVIQDFTHRTRFLPNGLILLNLLTSWSVFFSLRQYPPKERLFVYFRICAYLVVLRKIRKITFEKLVLFADMQPMDNLLAQYFSDKESVTLQHGLYVDYAHSDTINTINYEHHVSDHFLAWGKDTAELIKRYHPEGKVTICGKPNLQTSIPTSEPPGTPYFTVIFDQNMFEEYNLKLLEIAYQFSNQAGLKFCLRMHPWNDPEKYFLDKRYILETRPLSMSKFVVGHTTSMLYELLRIGVPAFKLKSPERALSTPDELQFADAAGLTALSLRDFSSRDCIELGKNYISYCGRESLSQYQAFFAWLGARDCQNNFDSKTSE